jgi:hypothetical protein
MSKELSNRQLKGITRIHSEDTILLDSEEWTIIVPHTHRNAVYWSKGAHWDTANPKDDLFFKMYKKRGDLIIIHDKLNGIKYQLHVKDKLFFNQDDVEVNPLQFFKYRKEIFNVILNHLETPQKRWEFMEFVFSK